MAPTLLTWSFSASREVVAPIIVKPAAGAATARHLAFAILLCSATVVVFVLGIYYIFFRQALNRREAGRTGAWKIEEKEVALKRSFSLTPITSPEPAALRSPKRGPGLWLHDVPSPASTVSPGMPDVPATLAVAWWRT